MKIQYEGKRYIAFKELEIGDTFEFGGNIYIKTEITEGYNCCNLTEYIISNMLDSQGVEPLKTTLIVHN